MMASGILQPRGRGSRRKLLAEGFESSYAWFIQGLGLAALGSSMGDLSFPQLR
jgi:hypothetical protein